MKLKGDLRTKKVASNYRSQLFLCAANVSRICFLTSSILPVVQYVLIFIFACKKIYTKCGRRAMPTMMMGSAAVFVDCDESWKFLLVTRKGSFYLWDLFNRKCLLQDSLASLLSSDPKANAGELENPR